MTHLEMIHLINDNDLPQAYFALITSNELHRLYLSKCRLLVGDTVYTTEVSNTIGKAVLTSMVVENQILINLN